MLGFCRKAEKYFGDNKEETVKHMPKIRDTFADFYIAFSIKLDDVSFVELCGTKVFSATEDRDYYFNVIFKSGVERRTGYFNTLTKESAIKMYNDILDHIGESYVFSYIQDQWKISKILKDN